MKWWVLFLFVGSLLSVNATEEEREEEEERNSDADYTDEIESDAYSSVSDSDEVPGESQCTKCNRQQGDMLKVNCCASYKGVAPTPRKMGCVFIKGSCFDLDYKRMSPKAQKSDPKYYQSFVEQHQCAGVGMVPVVCQSLKFCTFNPKIGCIWVPRGARPKPKAGAKDKKGKKGKKDKKKEKEKKEKDKKKDKKTDSDTDESDTEA